MERYFIHSRGCHHLWPPISQYVLNISRPLSLNALEVGVVHRDVGEAVRAVQDVVAVAHLKKDTLYITE